MVKVLIDQIECDHIDTKSLKLKYNSRDLANIDSARAATIIEVMIPCNARSTAIFGAEAQLHTAERFNQTWHPLKIESEEGITIFEGTAYLMEVVCSDKGEMFRVEGRGEVEEWALRASQSSIASVPFGGFNINLNQEGIESTWAESSPVKFLPIERDAYTNTPTGEDITGGQQVRTIDGYHPFINIKALLENFLHKYGYTIESSLLESEEFSNLFISGNYSSSESSHARSTMSFLLKREQSTTTTCNTNGRIYLSPYMLSNTFGNFADIESVNSDKECYNFGNVMQIRDQALIFRPLGTVSTGFEYRLHYIAQCKIASRHTLEGLNKLRYPNGYTIEWNIVNKNIDYRNDVVVGLAYNVAIFDFNPNKTYRIVGITSSKNPTPLTVLTHRFSQWSTSEEYHSYRIEEKNKNGTFSTYTGDWAIYSGYIDEMQETEIDVCVRSAPEEYGVNSPMDFSLLTLEGGIAGSTCKLLKDSYLKPYYAYYPGYNSKVWLSDIAVHDFSMLELIAAMQHLFNLRIYSDESSKRIFIETLDDFYTDKEWDWSDKLVSGEQITISNLAHSAHRKNKLGYQQKDGVVNRKGESDNAIFGEWEYTIDSYAASASARTELNPIFSATINTDEGVLAVGDRDDQTSAGSLNFSPRVVRYFDMREIEGTMMPYASFHSPEMNYTLCFEDRDQVQGLNRYYQSQCEGEQHSDLIKVTLKLNTFEYTNLFSPDNLNPSLRDIFSLSLKGETFRCRLYRVDSYDVEEQKARCTFLTID